jgi:hypothetical protein
VVPPVSYGIPRVPYYLGTTPRKGLHFAYRALTVYDLPFQDNSARKDLCNFPERLQPLPAPSRNPDRATLAGLTPDRFRLFPVRSPLLGKSRLISFPQGTEMFHFPWLALTALCIQAAVSRHDSGRVAPFGDPRINACLQLPEAFRSLPRPSSPSSTKASTVRP